VDIVYLGPEQKPLWIGEIKWSDRIRDHFSEATSAMELLTEKHDSISATFFTTRTLSSEATLNGRPLYVRPSAFHCYIFGRNITASLNEVLAEVPATVDPHKE
jgi:uncharacterized protein